MMSEDVHMKRAVVVVVTQMHINTDAVLFSNQSPSRRNRASAASICVQRGSHG